MKLARHIVRLVRETILFAFVARKPALAVAVIIGLILVAVVLATQVAAPLVIYPFG